MNSQYDLSLPWEENRTQEIFSQIGQEFLFRLNPHWIINGFSSSEESFRAEITDHETEQSFVITGKYYLNEGGYPEISTDQHPWQLIKFVLKDGSLHAQVSYSSEPEEATERHVILWLRSVKEYLRLYTKNSINTRFFRLLMNRVVLQMTPSQRKISLMLVRITILELLVIVVILVGWFFFLK